MSMVIDGTAGLTFNNATTQNSGGKVLQVVQGTTTNNTSATSTTPTATSLTASITPLFSTSKILIISTFSIYTTNASTKVVASLFRNSTNLSASNGGAYFYNGGGPGQISTTINLIDSPATTSATSYTIYISGNNASNLVAFNADNQNAYIILMEIAV
jgi:hypothetical protein